MELDNLFKHLTRALPDHVYDMRLSLMYDEVSFFGEPDGPNAELYLQLLYQFDGNKNIPEEILTHIKTRFSRTNINKIVRDLNIAQKQVSRDDWIGYIIRECESRVSHIMANGVDFEGKITGLSWVIVEMIQYIYPKYFTSREIETIRDGFITDIETTDSDWAGERDPKEIEKRAQIIETFGHETGDLMVKMDNVEILQNDPKIKHLLNTLDYPTIHEAQTTTKLHNSLFLTSGLFRIEKESIYMPKLLAWWLTAMIDAQSKQLKGLAEIASKTTEIEDENKILKKRINELQEHITTQTSEIAGLNRHNDELKNDINELKSGFLHSKAQKSLNRQADLIEALCSALDKAEKEENTEELSLSESSTSEDTVMQPSPTLDYNGGKILVVGGRYTLDLLKAKYNTENIVWIHAGEYSRLLRTPPSVDHVVFYRRPNSHAMYEIVKNIYGRNSITIV